MAHVSASSRCSIKGNFKALLEVLLHGVGRTRTVVSFAAVALLLGALCAPGTPIEAQTLAANWNQQVPINNPGTRYIHGMAYDAGHAQVVLFGGFNRSGYANDTWLWNGTNWTQANPATVPTPRAAPMMVYDPVHGNVVLFGGFTGGDGTPRLGDTWLWDGTNWTNATPAAPAVSPSPRSNSVMFFDPATNNVVLFGGTNGQALGDTWVWNGTTWSNVTPAATLTGAPGASPSPRSGASGAYDTATGQAVLFGGDSNGAYQNDTWLWNGQIWAVQNPGNKPTPRGDMGMVYNAALGQLVLFGGDVQTNGTAYFNETWLWNGSTWTKSFPTLSPPARSVSNSLVYDAAQSQVLLYGGYSGSSQLGDTWEFGNPGNFSNVNVCPAGATSPAPCSSTETLTYFFANGATLGTAPQVLTQGTTGLDFTLGAGSTCIGTVAPGTCTVNVTFAPFAPGVRAGAVNIVDYTGVILATTPVYGVGQGPAAAVAPGSSSSVASNLNTPYGAAVDAAGNIYFTDSRARTVTKVAPNGTSTSLGVTFTTPTGVAVDGAGDVFVADQGAGTIVEIPSGCIPNSCQNTLATPTGVTQQTAVAVDGAGDVFFSSLSPAQVSEIPAGCTLASCVKMVWTPPAGAGTSQPTGIAVDAAGDLFIADGALVQVLKVPAGCTSTSCQVKVGVSWIAPTGVAVDAAGDVFVSDANISGIVEVPAGCAVYGCQSRIFAGGAPFGVAVDAQGSVIVPLLTGNAVYKVSLSETQAFNFPATNVGSSSAPESLTLQNIGTQPLNSVSPGLLVVNGPNFANVAGPGTPGTPVDCSATATLASGAQCNVSIIFTPQAPGNPVSSTAVFHDNALNAAAATQTVALNGVATGLYTIGGAVSGLTGTGLVLQDNLANNLPVAGNGLFTFPTSLATASPYSVTVLTQPSGQACTVTNGSGTVASANITNVQVTCASAVNYALTVTDSGTGTGTVSDDLGQISCYKPYGTVGNTCSGSYPGGTMVTLTASPSDSSIFAGWGGACSNFGATLSCSVTMNSALSVNATFVASPAVQAGALAPITAGVVYGQGGSFASNTANNGGVNANSLNLSQGMVFDGSGNLYVSDGKNNRVLFYPAGSTTATRVYGQNGSLTSNAQNNGGTSANSLSNPQGLALDGGGNLYVSDQYNSRVLFYPAGSTTATRVYGQSGSFTGSVQNNGGVSANSLSAPGGIALDGSGNLYVADYGNSRVLFYPAGSTTATRVYGQGGSFTSSAVNNGGISANSLNQAWGVGLDASGDLYVADSYNNRILFYPANSTTATQVYGHRGSFTTGTINDGGVNTHSLYTPIALTVDGNGSLYVADRDNNRVLYYPFGSATANRVYGQSGSFTGSAQNNGGASANSLYQPWAVALDKSGNVYIADYGNNRLLEYGSHGKVNACPAHQGTPAPCSNTITYSYAPVANTAFGATQVVTQGATGLDFSLGGTTCTGTIFEGSTCNVDINFTPLAPGVRAGAVELFDSAGNLVANTLTYGVGLASEMVFGPQVATLINTGTLSTPRGVLIDAAGNLFVSDTTLQQVIKIAPNGTKTTVGVGLQYPQQMAEDGAGNLYIADNNLNEIVEVPAGCTASNCQRVLGGNLRSQLGVAVDGAGNVFIGDFLDGEVIKSPAGCSASVCQSIVYSPGAGSNPNGIAVDAAGNLYVADFGLKQVVEVPAGCGSQVCQIKIGSGWSQPDGVAVDAAGDVFIADAGLDEVIEAPAGCTAAACLGVVVSGLNTVAVTVDSVGNLFFEDFVNSRVIELSPSGFPSFSFAQTNVGGTSNDSPRAISVQNIGNQPLTGSLDFNLGGNFTQNNPLDCAALFPLAPGASCGETFSFTPQSATFLQGTAVFSDNSLNVSSATQTLTLKGTGAIGGVAPTVAVPNVVGQAQAAAVTPIAGVGLVMGTVSTASSQTVPAGTIISENPVAGTQVSVGSTVNLLVSSGLPQPPSPNPLLLENNYFLTGDYVSAGVTLRGTGNLTSKIATGTITILNYTQSATQGVPDGADIVDAFLYWETIENTALPSSTNGTFNGYSIVGQQIGADIPNYADGAVTGTLRAYRASVNLYLPVGANGIRIASGAYKVSLPDSGGSTYPVTEGASLVLVYRVLSPNFPLKSVVIYDGAALPAPGAVQVVQGFYDAVGGASGTGKNTNIFASGGNWQNNVNPVTLGKASQYTAPLTPTVPYAAVILSTPVNNSDNDGILDAWKNGPAASDFHAGQPGYYDVKTGTWVGLPGAKHGQKDLFVQLDYMCGALLASGACDPAKENLFPSPDANGNDPLIMVQQAFAQSGVQLHLTIGNAVPEDTCTDNTSVSPAQLCQFPGQPGVIGWKNSLEFSKLYPRNLAACLTGGDCTTRFPYGQKDSYHYVLFGHSLAIPAYNTRFGSVTSIKVANGITTIVTPDRGTGVNACPSRITIAGVLGDPALNGVYNTTTPCLDSKTIIVPTPGVPNYTYPNNTLPEPVIGITFGKTTSISGYSDLGGADSAVTLGLWLTAPNQDMSKKANVLAGTLFHEIGHTLGLGHGGIYYDTPNSYVPTFEGNCKPNYQSIMNYLFQLDGVGPNEAVAFSNQSLLTLNESAAGGVTQLTDGSGNPATFSTSAWYVPDTTGSGASAATRHCDGTPLTGDSIYRVDAPISPINPPWSNGQDLNGIGTLQTQERGFNDLANMDLRQVGATGGQFASLATLLSFGSSVAPLNISAGGNVVLGSGGTIALGSGGTVTLGSGGNVTLGSGGTIALGSGGTVTLGSGGNVTLGSGGTITLGSGGTVALGSGGNVTLGSGGTITLGSGGTIALGSGGNVTLGSGGTIALGSGGTVTIPSSGGSYTIDGAGGTVTLGIGGNVTLGSGGNVTLGSGGTIALGSGGNVTLGSGGNVTLGSGGTIALGSGGNVTLGSGGNVTLGSGGTITLGSGGTVTLGSGGNVTLGSGGTVTLGSGGNVALGSGGNVTLGSGGTATLGAGGTVTLGSGGNVTLGSGGTITLGSGGNVTLGSGGVIPLSAGGSIAVGVGGTVTLGSGGTIALGSGGVTISIAAGGSYTFTGSGGTVTLGSGGNVTLGSGGNVTLGSGGTIALGSGGNVTLGSGGTITFGSGGNVTLGSGGVVTLGTGGSVNLGTGSDVSLGSVSSVTPGSGGPLSDELNYETANSVVRAPTSPTQTKTSMGVRISWNAPAFGVVATYTIYRSSNGAAPIVIGSVSGVNGNPPATEFTDTNPDSVPIVVYTISTTLVPDTTGGTQRQSAPSAPAVLKNDQTIILGLLPSPVLITRPPTVTATAMSNGSPNGLQVVFAATGSCTIASQSIASNVSSALVTLKSTGSCTITASQPGTTTFNAANAVSGTFMVLPQGSTTKSQTINFAQLPNVQYGSSFTANATSSAGLAIGITASGPCTTNGSIGSTNGLGVCSITASAAGNSTYSAASLTQSFTIYPAVLKVTANNVASTFGQPFPAFTYSYSGFVKTDTSAVVSGVPALSTTATPTSGVGRYPITVATGTLAATNYSFLYVSGVLTVQPAAQTIAFTKNPPASASYKSSFTVAATSTSGGPVAFTSSGACTNIGATYTITNSTGTCSVIANQPGTANYSAAAPVTKTVTATGPMVTVSVSSLNFGTVYQGSISAQTFTITNTGSLPATINDPFLSIVKGGNSNEFIALSLCPKPLAPGRSCTVLIGFIAGPFYTPQTATLQIMSNAPGSPQSVTISATVINPQATFNPTSLSFGTVKYATSRTLNVTFSNPGATPLSLTSMTIRGANATYFTQTNACGTSLAAGASCIVAVKFTPPVTGNFSASLTATDNAKAGSGAQTVALSGTGN